MDGRGRRMHARSVKSRSGNLYWSPATRVPGKHVLAASRRPRGTTSPRQLCRTAAEAHHSPIASWERQQEARTHQPQTPWRKGSGYGRPKGRHESFANRKHHRPDSSEMATEPCPSSRTSARSCSCAGACEALGSEGATEQRSARCFALAKPRVRPHFF